MRRGNLLRVNSRFGHHIGGSQAASTLNMQHRPAVRGGHHIASRPPLLYQGWDDLFIKVCHVICTICWYLTVSEGKTTPNTTRDEKDVKRWSQIEKCKSKRIPWWRYFNIAEFLCQLKRNSNTYTSGQLHNNINDGPLNK